MAQYTVNYSCGHTGSVNLFGPGRDRERKIEWLERAGSCPECHQQEKQKQQQQLLDELANTTPELPALVGSDKQIAWADTIRAEVIIRSKKWVDDKEKGIEGRTFSTAEQNQINQMRKYFAETIADLESQTSAKWWIENRTYQLIHDVKNRWEKDQEKKQ